MKKILYFEDDLQLGALVVEYLAKKQIEVTHYSGFDIYEKSDVSVSKDQFDAVLLDIEMPDVNGYEICKSLKEEGLSENTPVIFVSGLMNSEDILKAYKAGGHDYLVKPLKLTELEAKLTENIRVTANRHQLQQELDCSQDMAMKVMMSMSELGAVLRFHDECMNIDETEQIVKKLFELLTGLGLNSSIVVHSHQSGYFTSNGAGSQLELQTIKLLSSYDRIYSWNNRTCFNYDSFSLLVTNMPITDEVRFGELKDVLCLILNGLDARFDAIRLATQAKKRTNLLAGVIDELCSLVSDMSKNNKALSGQFEMIIDSVENNIAGDIVQFNLLEEEEKILISHINDCLKGAQKVFDKSLSAELSYQKQVQQLSQLIIAAD